MANPGARSAPKGRLAAQAIYSTVCPFSSESGNQDSPNVNNSSAVEFFISSSVKPVCSRNLGFQAKNERRSKSTIALGKANSFKIAHNSCRFCVDRSMSTRSLQFALSQAEAFVATLAVAAVVFAALM